MALFRLVPPGRTLNANELPYCTPLGSTVNGFGANPCLTVSASSLSGATPAMGMVSLALGCPDVCEA